MEKDQNKVEDMEINDADYEEPSFEDFQMEQDAPKERYDTRDAMKAYDQAHKNFGSKRNLYE